MQSTIETLFHALRTRLSGVRALVLLGDDGRLLGHAAADSAFNIDLFTAEYATFLRIASRTAQDTGMGDVEEHISISASTVVISCRLPPNHFAVFVCSIGEHLGRLRYELKRSLLYSSFSNL